MSLPAQQFNPLKHPRSKKAQHKTGIKIMCNVFRYTLSPGRGATGYKQTTWTEHVPGQGLHQTINTGSTGHESHPKSLPITSF